MRINHGGCSSCSAVFDAWLNCSTGNREVEMALEGMGYTVIQKTQ